MLCRNSSNIQLSGKGKFLSDLQDAVRTQTYITQEDQNVLTESEPFEPELNGTKKKIWKMWTLQESKTKRPGLSDHRAGLTG